jgi:SOS-response transcriptional repressor LexA
MPSYLPTNLFYLREQTRRVENLKSLSREKFVQLTKLADLGINGNNWNSYENRGSIPPINILEYLIHKFNISLDDLFFKDLKNGIVEKKTATEDYTVRIIDHKASAGFGVGFGDAKYIKDLRTMTVPFRVPKESLAFEIEGDSMYPYVDDGSFVITSRLDSLNQIQNGKNYIVVTEESILYKMIYQQEDTLSLVSLNIKYPPLMLSKESVIQVWSTIGRVGLG